MFQDTFYMGFYVVSIYLSVLWVIIYLENRKVIFKYPVAKILPAITFLLPAYNESKTIGRCIKSLLDLDYPKNKMKIIVVNDGSTDNTAKIASKFKKHGVVLLNKKNGGKASALNYGMKYVNTELVACMDTDSVATKDYLKKIVGYFGRNNIAAVTTSTKILNTKTIMQQIQWAEYLISMIFRKLLAILECQFAVPGTGSVYKTSVLRKVGLFDVTNNTEDMEIAMRLHSKGYKIENSIDAYVYTDCPKSFTDLLKQRMRWYRGYLFNFRKYSFMIFNRKYGNFGVFYIPMTLLWTSFIIGLFLISVYSFIFTPISYLFKIGLIIP